MMAAFNARPTKLPPLPLKNQPLVRQGPSVSPGTIPQKTREGRTSPSGTIKQELSQDISPTSIRTNEEQESLIVLLLSKFMAYVASKAYVQALEVANQLAIVDPTNALIKEYQPVLRERIAQLEAASSEEAENSPEEESDSEEEDNSDADTSGTEEDDSEDEETCESNDSSSDDEQ
ncbi:uncharacterized protein SPPG_01371 [Spizellomyces punctatus DAOM BR117]|uniref:Uncharacterized protein n=1 Tax=Spizellomyces punctatus (strain DAOM BR117) TaxID=645134 RepID=A0A0L0HS62_SPIPD|nr:uncharacterized protein SPPG_01371 [Spizellomyces punctatus DAOM BR117]KND03922.1 hypothetical protein SPPG_01371 [Spizellomyces punctatus DAOM BR117]|eukprot:XP_016611961.1 hypothetical protein SPPG_01371 [Spizellomyces punctatus DAOM BR117]